MNALLSAFWAEALKARRSKVALLSAVVFSILPVTGGLFMIILKNPEQARAMGLISAKAQLAAGTADWPAFFDLLLQATAMGGTILFAFITAWIFGREFSDHTAKEFLALPTPRGAIILAKFGLNALWVLGLTLMIFAIGHAIGMAVDIPGWSAELEWKSFWTLMTIALLIFLLGPFIALFASAGRGYLPALGWAFLSFVLAQIVSLLGWGDWLPWSVPVLVSGMFGAGGAEQIGTHSYVMVLLAFVAGMAATLIWWQRADQAR